MDILDDMGVSKLSAKIFLKSELYSFNGTGNRCVTNQKPWKQTRTGTQAKTN